MQLENYREIEKAAHSKKFMSIAGSVLTTSPVARNNNGVALHESNPQSATAYSFER
jgi:hypothetical protein